MLNVTVIACKRVLMMLLDEEVSEVLERKSFVRVLAGLFIHPSIKAMADSTLHARTTWRHSPTIQDQKEWFVPSEKDTPVSILQPMSDEVHLVLGILFIFSANLLYPSL